MSMNLTIAWPFVADVMLQGVVLVNLARVMYRGVHGPKWNTKVFH